MSFFSALRLFRCLTMFAELFLLLFRRFGICVKWRMVCFVAFDGALVWVMVYFGVFEVCYCLRLACDAI